MEKTARRDFLLEIGLEELPARFAAQAVYDFANIAAKAFSEARIVHGGIRSYVTPRRLALYVEGMHENQSSVDRRVKGPSTKAAFDENGQPTKAAEGFARSQGVEISSFTRVSDGNGEYVYANVHEEGKRIDVVLPFSLDYIIRGMSFPKNMRWGTSDFRFVRPIRWLLALWGDEVVPFSFERLSAGAISYGHRTLGPGGSIKIPAAEAYIDSMKSAGVLVDQEERKEAIEKLVKAEAVQIGGEAEMDSELLDEICHIVEWPTAFTGSFDPKYLALPDVCITTPMVDHQRYFPVRRGSRLMSNFIAVRNGGKQGIDNVKHGNERVLAARLADAEFFFREDTKKSLASRFEMLAGITFAEGLGTVKDKSERIARLARMLLESTDKQGVASENELELTERAALLSKCDLATNMVREFTELQGEIGRIYADLDGEDKSVADAIAEHYKPRSADDSIPQSRLGAALAMADKADSLAGYFSIGKVPTGSADPFALRRNALGLIAIHEARRPMMGLLGLLSAALNEIWKEDAPKPKADIMKELTDFMEGRLRGQLIDEGHRYDLVEAAMALGAESPAMVRISLEALESNISGGWMEDLSVAFVRVRNIARNAESSNFSCELMSEAAETALTDEYLRAEKEIGLLLAGRVDSTSVAAAMSRFSSLKPAIDRFFDEVMVMCEDQTLRRNRLGLVKAIEALALRMADFSKITA